MHNSNFENDLIKNYGALFIKDLCLNNIIYFLDQSDNKTRVCAFKDLFMIFSYFLQCNIAIVYIVYGIGIYIK